MEVCMSTLLFLVVYVGASMALGVAIAEVAFRLIERHARRQDEALR
jgi:hypothetical protein